MAFVTLKTTIETAPGRSPRQLRNHFVQRIRLAIWLAYAHRQIDQVIFEELNRALPAARVRQ